MLAISEKTKKSDHKLICNPLDNTAESVLQKSSQQRFLSDLMALKNERSEDGHAKSKLFFAIGLTLSLLFTIMAFEWRTYDAGDVMDLGMIANDFDEIIEIPPTEQLPPPPPVKIVAPIIKEVSDDEIIEEISPEIDLEVSEDMIIENVEIFDFNEEVPEEKIEQIFDIVETQPTPEGGMQTFYAYVAKNLTYPAKAARLDISGRVFVQFVVEKDGTLTDVKVIKSLYEDCDQEAIRVIENAPKWNPGKQRGMPVRVYQRLPITFVLR